MMIMFSFVAFAQEEKEPKDKDHMEHKKMMLQHIPIKWQ